MQETGTPGVSPRKIFAIKNWNLMCDLLQSDAFWRFCCSPVFTFVYKDRNGTALYCDDVQCLSAGALSRK